MNLKRMINNLPDIKIEDICIVPDNLIAQIINSNLSKNISIY